MSSNISTIFGTGEQISGEYFFFKAAPKILGVVSMYEGWNFNSGNYLFTTDTKEIHVSKFYCPSV